MVKRSLFFVVFLLLVGDLSGMVPVGDGKTKLFSCNDEGSDLYAVLGVVSSASMDEITKAYRALALKHHPDKNRDSNTQEEFQKINEAYNILSDKKKRAIYDKKRAEDAFQRELQKLCYNHPVAMGVLMSLKAVPTLWGQILGGGSVQVAHAYYKFYCGEEMKHEKAMAASTTANLLLSYYKDLLEGKTGITCKELKEKQEQLRMQFNQLYNIKGLYFKLETIEDHALLPIANIIAEEVMKDEGKEIGLVYERQNFRKEVMQENRKYVVNELLNKICSVVSVQRGL